MDHTSGTNRTLKPQKTCILETLECKMQSLIKILICIHNVLDIRLVAKKDVSLVSCTHCSMQSDIQTMGKEPHENENGMRTSHRFVPKHYCENISRTFHFTN